MSLALEISEWTRWQKNSAGAAVIVRGLHSQFWIAGRLLDSPHERCISIVFFCGQQEIELEWKSSLLSTRRRPFFGSCRFGITRWNDKNSTFYQFISGYGSGATTDAIDWFISIAATASVVQRPKRSSLFVWMKFVRTWSAGRSNERKTEFDEFGRALESLDSCSWANNSAPFAVGLLAVNTRVLLAVPFRPYVNAGEIMMLWIRLHCSFFPDLFRSVVFVGCCGRIGILNKDNTSTPHWQVMKVSKMSQTSKTVESATSTSQESNGPKPHRRQANDPQHRPRELSSKSKPTRSYGVHFVCGCNLSTDHFILLMGGGPTGQLDFGTRDGKAQPVELDDRRQYYRAHPRSCYDFKTAKDFAAYWRRSREWRKSFLLLKKVAWDGSLETYVALLEHLGSHHVDGNDFMKHLNFYLFKELPYKREPRYHGIYFQSIPLDANASLHNPIARMMFAASNL